MFIKTMMNISEEDYNKLLKCSKEEVENFVAEVSNKSPFPACGYGLFSPSFFEENGKYYVSWERFSSCD